MPQGKASEIVLTDEEHAALERHVRRRKTASALALRSRIILLASEGLHNGEIAEALSITRATAGKWRARFAVERIDGLLDEPRVGRSRDIDDDRIESIIVATLESAPDGASHWSTRAMAKRFGLSQSTISRVWRAFGLQPHRSE